MLTDYERQHYTPETQRSLLIVREADDNRLLHAARNEHSEAFADLIEALGGNLDTGGKTNPRWLTMMAATTAYERGLIDEQELDRLLEDA